MLKVSLSDLSSSKISFSNSPFDDFFFSPFIQFLNIAYYVFITPMCSLPDCLIIRNISVTLLTSSLKLN